MATTGGSGGRPAGNWLAKVKLIAILLVSALVVIVFFQNINKQDTYDVLFWDPQIPRALALLATLVVGAVAGAVAAHLLRRRGG